MGVRHDKFRDSDIRKRAEERFSKQLDTFAELAEKDKKYLAHELGTYQIELEIQNEDLRIAKQELERSRDIYMRLYDFAPVGYFTVDEKSVVHSVNHAGAAMLGFTCARVPGTAFRTFVLKEDFTRFRKYLGKVFFRQDLQILEIRMVRTDGSQFFAELRSRIMAGDDRSEPLCQIAVIDVTDREQAVEYKKWADIFNNTQIGLYIRGNGPARLDMVNPAFALMHGYTVEELFGMPLKDLSENTPL
jgi:PAS domain S-box-containing protein